MDITVFTSTGWGPCHMVKVYLSQRNIPFTERNVSLESDARKTLMELGFRTTPLTLIGGEKVLGYNPTKLEAALAVSGI